MHLKMICFNVYDVVSGAKTGFSDHRLSINLGKLKAKILSDGILSDVEINIAVPGDGTRIVHILDVVEPRVKPDNGVSAYPGLTGTLKTVGQGTTYRMGGLTVMSCAEFPEFDANSMMAANEAIVDMSPNSSLSPFSQTINLVLTFTAVRDERYSTAKFVDAVKAATWEAAVYLAESLKNLTPQEVERNGVISEYTTDVELQPGLPRLGLVFPLPSLALPLRESYIYGRPVSGMLPTVLHPNEVLDGAVAGFYLMHGGVRNPTFFYQNNSLVNELYRGHGSEHNFAGVIFTRSGRADDEGKNLLASVSAGLARLLDMQGAIVCAPAGGHHTVDFMMTVEELEKAGVKTVGIAAEVANPEGEGLVLPYFSQAADALISTGNREQVVPLGTAGKVIGGSPVLLNSGLDAKAETSIPYRNILGSGAQLGEWIVSAKEY